MQHQALYRKWRPQTFGDVCGQEHITSILEYETENNKFSHAYLFCGSRGTGKTTCAKILAKAVNCESPVNGSPCNKCAACRSIDMGTATDVLEMDAASNNGVDNIRDIRDEVVYSPTALKYRVYIVDEVHMLSLNAFNALLKTLEEPPEHAVFILATTELHKLPTTIVSRCQRYDFRRIATETLVDRLAYISDNEGIEYTKEALRIIARMAQGGMRDAISLLELCAGNRQKITAELVNDSLGTGGRESAERVARAVAQGDFDTIFAAVDTVVASSKDLAVFWHDLEAFYRDMLVIKTTKEAKSYLDLTDDETERLLDVASLFNKETLLYHCRILDETLYDIQKAGATKRTMVEMALVRMCDGALDSSVDNLLSRIAKLEQMIAGGGFTAPVRAEVNTPAKAENTEKPEKKPEPAPDKVAPIDVPKPVVQTLKAFRGWNEIVDKVSATEMSAAGYLRMSKTFVDPDGKVYVRFPGEFARMMVDTPAIRETIRASLCMALGRPLTDGDIVFDIFKGDEDAITDLDDLDV